MVSLVTKKSGMMLYSSSNQLDSHRVRFVLAEKGVVAEIQEVDLFNESLDLQELNPYQILPTFVDRTLVLYHAPIILEYLDERFPHPPLLPVYPIARAQARLLTYRMERDLYQLVDELATATPKQADSVRQLLLERLLGLSPLFAKALYLLGEEFSLVDCTMLPLLWRLPKFGIELPKSAKDIQKYMERHFARPSFQASLTDTEREIRL